MRVWAAEGAVRFRVRVWAPGRGSGGTASARVRGRLERAVASLRPIMPAAPMMRVDMGASFGGRGAWIFDGGKGGGGVSRVRGGLRGWKGWGFGNRGREQMGLSQDHLTSSALASTYLLFQRG